MDSRFWLTVVAVQLVSTRTEYWRDRGIDSVLEADTHTEKRERERERTHTIEELYVREYAA